MDNTTTITWLEDLPKKLGEDRSCIVNLETAESKLRENSEGNRIWEYDPEKVYVLTESGQAKYNALTAGFRMTGQEMDATELRDIFDKLTLDSRYAVLYDRPKYEMIEDEDLMLEYEDHTLFRIRALKDIFNSSTGDIIHKGDLGGYIERPSNLSQEGNCFVKGQAKIMDEAIVCDNAIVEDYAEVAGNAKIEENAIVAGSAQIGHDAVITGWAVIKDMGRVYGNSVVGDDSLVCENATILGDSTVMGESEIGGNVRLIDAIVENDVLYETEEVEYENSKGGFSR